VLYIFYFIIEIEIMIVFGDLIHNNRMNVSIEFV